MSSQILTRLTAHQRGYSRYLTGVVILCCYSFYLNPSRSFGGEPIEKSAHQTSSEIESLIQVVKSQIQVVEELKKQNQELARKNEDLQGRVKSLETKTEQRIAEDPKISKATIDPPELNLSLVPSTSMPAASLPNLPELPKVDWTENSSLVLPDPLPVPEANLLPELVITTNAPSDLTPPSGAGLQKTPDFLLGRYDNGYILVAPKNPKEHPFALKANIVTQDRYTGFFRNVEQWQPRNTRPAVPVNNRSTFDITRAYLGFSGFALDPKLQYSFMLATTSTVNVSYILAVLGYQFNKELGLYFGYNKVPGTREWFESFKNTMGADRSMATTFFRPSMSPGVWITGEPLPDFHYYGMISNSVNSLAQLGDRQTTQMSYAGNVWWEPLGSFGPGFTDAEFHDKLAVRLGSTAVYDRLMREYVIGSIMENPENTVTRLSNGNPIFTPGAIAPGVNLLTASDFLWTLDAGLKYRGLGLSGEYYFRWLNNFQTDRPMPGIKQIYDQGGYVQLSYAIVPKKLELYTKSSLIAGPYGSGNDYGGGVNWYVNGTRKWRATAEVLQINRSPANNILTGYRTGESGTLLQLQMITDF
jgi:hypothetical protein